MAKVNHLSIYNLLYHLERLIMFTIDMLRKYRWEYKTGMHTLQGSRMTPTSCSVGSPLGMAANIAAFSMEADIP